MYRSSWPWSSLVCQRRDKNEVILPHALRMQLLVTPAANAEQLPLARFRVEDGQGQVWPVLQVFHVVYQIGGADAVTEPTELAFVVVQEQNLPAHAFPLRPIIKPIRCPGR